MILGNCLEVVPTLKEDIEIAVTSPPYNLFATVSKNRREDYIEKNWYDDFKSEYIYQAEQKELIKQLLKVCNSSIFYNHKIRYAWHSRNTYRGASKMYHPLQWLLDFPIWCEIIWDRGIPARTVPKRYHIKDERIYQIGKPKYSNEKYNCGNIWRIQPTQNSTHPCSFPVDIPARAALYTTKENDYILDPYIGSGTTAIAAIRNNRRFIGIENNTEFFNLACKNIELELAKDRQQGLSFGGLHE